MIYISAAWAFVKLYRRYFVIGGIALALAGGFVAFEMWKSNLIETATKAGFGQAEAQYKAEVEAADKIAARDQKLLDGFSTAFGGLASARAQAITLKVQPIIEGMKNEIASDPRYRDCVVSDGVLDSINSARSTVNAGIDASAPGQP